LYTEAVRTGTGCDDGEKTVILNVSDEDEFIQELADLFDTPLISEAKYQRVLDLLGRYEMEVKKMEDLQ
jgi:hypothetical protein